MCKKIMRVRSLGIIILIFAVLLSFIILRKDYLLNKTVREVALRMVQLDGYRGRVLNRQSKFEFIFSQGSLREYRVRDKGRMLPRYVVVEFYFPGSSKKKSLIFYKKGDWKVLG